MVQLASKSSALKRLRVSTFRALTTIGGGALVMLFLYSSCSARVLPHEFGIEQVRFGTKVGIGNKEFGPGLYLIGPGTTMRTFPREIHVLEATNEQNEAIAKAKGNAQVKAKVLEYFEERNELLGAATHREIEAFNVQTSDGYSVAADVTLLYSIQDPVKIAKEFGWGPLYVEGFVINTFRNGVLATLGKMSAEQFYGEQDRIKAVAEAEAFLREKFRARGFEVHKLLLRNYHYSDTYERSLQDKKIAVQLTVKNRKESLVNEERAKLQQLESKGNAAITIAESEVAAQIARVTAEAELYSSQVRAKADQEVGLAAAEAKRLKSDALTHTGGRYVVALETAKMFGNIEAAVMTPEQYVAFVRNAWSLIGLSGSPAQGAK